LAAQGNRCEIADASSVDALRCREKTTTNGVAGMAM